MNHDIVVLTLGEVAPPPSGSDVMDDLWHRHELVSVH